MDDIDVNISGNSTVEEIREWLNKQLIKMEELKDTSENNPSDKLLTEAKNILNNSTTIVNEKYKHLESENIPDQKAIMDEFNAILDNMSTIVTVIESKNDTSKNAAMALSELLNDTTFQEIQEIEKQILYRKFYFPGGIPKLRIAGQGINKPNDDFEYDQSTGDVDPFDHWDPRYLNEYITIAKQNGFHRNFIYYNGRDFNTINFSQAYEVLKNCVNWTTGKIDTTGSCDKYEVVGIIGGLLYFDKVASFVEETKLAGGKTNIFNRVVLYNSDIIQPTVDKLANGLIQQSEKNFKNNNFGWMASNNKYAFDSAQYLSKWMELENQYNEYRERVWDILKNLNALQLCTNNVNVTGNNITIQQEMECIQTITDSDGNEETHETSDIDSDKDKNKDEDKNEHEDKNENEDDTSQYKPDDDKNIHDISINNMYLIIAIVVAFLLIMGIIFTVVYYKRKYSYKILVTT